MPGTYGYGIYGGGTYSTGGGEQTVTIGGLSSSEAFGHLSVGNTLVLTGIPTSQAFGVLHYSTALTLHGIVTGEREGSLTATGGFVPPDIPITRAVRTLTICERLSSPVIDQNVPPTGSLDIGSFDPDTYTLFQDFFLPDNYARGVTDSKNPPLTGYQVLCDVVPRYEDVAALDWTLQHKVDEGWVDLTSGTTVGATESGTQVWFTIYFPQPVPIPDELLTSRFRIGLRARDYTEIVKEEIPDNQPLVINNEEFDEVNLLPGTSQHLIIDDVPSVLYRDLNTEKIYYSQEYGVTNAWFVSPSPLDPVDLFAYTSEGTLGAGTLGSGTMGGDLGFDGNAALMFRVLAGIADEGTDFLGNSYRNVVTRTSLDNAHPLNTDNQNAYWLSKPNPSQFATESLYFDISQDNDLTTIDHILLDPVTPGIYFNVYYSSEGEAGVTKTDWENKLWTPVPSTFRAQQRLTHPMPIPITAKFIKIEFTQLQPRWYAPGSFQKEILYDKFPKWVLDYYLLALDAGTVSPNTEDSFIARTITQSTSALALGYTYYLDDLRDTPLTPRELIQNPSNFNSFLAERGSQSDRVDPQTLARIKTAFQPFTSQPGLSGAVDSLLSLYTNGSGGFVKTGDIIIRPDYPTELLFEFTKNINPLVSTLERDPLLVEKSMPVMKYFIKARHRYRTVKAKFENDKAYFAGVNEIAFLRDDYAMPFDRDMVVEIAGDSANVERNDFAHDDTGLVVTND